MIWLIVSGVLFLIACIVAVVGEFICHRREFGNKCTQISTLQEDINKLKNDDRLEETREWCRHQNVRLRQHGDKIGSILGDAIHFNKRVKALEEAQTPICDKCRQPIKKENQRDVSG